MISVATMTHDIVVLFYCVLTVVSSLGNLSRPLPVLLLLPYPDSNGSNGWDRGLELLPAARVAAKEINSRSDILPGYVIELIERGSDACGKSVVTRGLHNLIPNALNPFEDNTNAIAVLGLACSTVTASVSPIAGRFDLLQVAMANSHVLRDKQTYPHLWRLLSSSDVLTVATVSLMKKYDWKRIGLISDGNGFFFQAIATALREAAHAENFTLVVDQGIDSTPSIIASALDRIHSEGVRIIFAPTTIPESVEIMCQATKRNLIWPGYVWIFPSKSYQSFQNLSNDCAQKIIEGLENVILVDFEIGGRNDEDILVSGYTYKEYRSKYDVEYNRVKDEFKNSSFQFSDVYNVYANPMYDEVWVLALAINNSLPELELRKVSPDSYQYGMPEITQIIEKHLMNVSFSGSLSNIYFDEFNEVPTNVNIFQVRNHNSTLIGTFINHDLVIFNDTDGNYPSDDFIENHDLLQAIFPIELYINAVILIFITTVLLLVSLILRKEPEILAISPLLSMLIFVGCYQLTFASVFTATTKFVIITPDVYLFLCYFKDWSAHSGINLITTTILVRLVRIYRIFTHFGKTSKFWQDKYLFFVIIIIACLSDVVIIIGIIVDPLEFKEKRKYLLDENPPKVSITTQCTSQYSAVLYVITKLYSGFLILLLLTFAILTRKVNRKNFKDTKKISAFVFTFTIVATFSAVISSLFNSIDKENIAVLITSYSYQMMSLLCLIILIVPKAVPAFYYRVYKKQRRSFHTQAEKDTTISNLVIRSLKYTTSRRDSSMLLVGNYNFSTINNEKK